MPPELLSDALVERVARALYDAEPSPIGGLEIFEYDYQRRLNGDEWVLLKRARAAIEASGLVELAGALTAAQEAIASLDEGALGYDWQGDPEVATQSWPLRDELLHNIDAALAKVRQP